VKTQRVQVGQLALDDRGAFKIGPFGSSLKKSELVSSGIPVVGIENVMPNQFIKGFGRFITPKKFEELSNYEILPGDILVTTMGTIGRAAILPSDLGRAIFDSHLFRMRVDTTQVYPSYLCYAINSDLVALQLSQMARGAIMEGLNTTILRECKIPLPSLPEQKRVVGLLEHADRLRRIRLYALELSETFLPASFLVLFGDPVNNERGWQTITLESASVKITDGEHLNPRFVTTGFPIVMAEQVEGSGVNLESCKLVSTEDFNKFIKKCEPKAGDILVVSRGATIGRTCVVNTKKQFCLMGSVILIRPDSTVVNPYFLSSHLKSISFLRVLRTTSAASAQQAIYIAHLKDKVIVVPPMSLQMHFAGLVHQHDRLLSNQRETLRQAEHLFQTLLHQSFADA
jgi:type I restriction enzyme S subunit